MTSPSADYDAAVAALRAQTLPAFLEYTQDGNARGIAGWTGTPERIVVDVRKKKVVSVTPRNDDNWDGSNNDSPVLKHLFTPACYIPTSERSVNWNGQNVLAISVHQVSESCGKDDVDVNTIYADATSMQLLGADGSETEDEMTVDFSVHYAMFGNYLMPTSLQAHAHGHGWLFWARERAEMRFSNYAFTETRRQSQ